MKKESAGNSKQIKRFRKSIEKKFEIEKPKITYEALKDVKQAIKTHLANNPERIKLSSRTITQIKDPSKSIQKFISRIQK